MKKVQVLMSTYNGEKYLKEQIDSIIAQKGVDVHLLVRDDESKDNTLQILREYESINIIEGKNEGATGSFLSLIELAGDYDYYAFSDQDDVWDNDKLLCAVEKLDHFSCPAIYSGNTRLVDRDLNYIKCETLTPITTLGSAFVKNYVTGCTAVFNRELLDKLKDYRPKNAPFHDWWVNLVCLANNGISIYDYTPHMDYRQHGNNVVSGNDSFLKKWKSRFNKFYKGQYHRDRIAMEIRDHYFDDISKENLKILDTIIQNKYVKNLQTGNRVDDLLFIICEILRKA